MGNTKWLWLLRWWAEFKRASLKFTSHKIQSSPKKISYSNTLPHKMRSKLLTSVMKECGLPVTVTLYVIVICYTLWSVKENALGVRLAVLVWAWLAGGLTRLIRSALARYTSRTGHICRLGRDCQRVEVTLSPVFIYLFIYLFVYKLIMIRIISVSDLRLQILLFLWRFCFVHVATIQTFWFAGSLQTS